jgi:hypothetical protein
MRKEAVKGSTRVDLDEQATQDVFVAVLGIPRIQNVAEHG